MMPPSPRNQRRKAARPDEIIAAAIQLFHQKGFTATRIDEVAAAAGVTKGTVYLYFPSKEALFKAVVQERILPNLARMHELVAQFRGSRRDCLSMVLRGVAEALENCGGSISKLMIAEAGNFPELARFYETEVIEPTYQTLRQILSEGMASGEFRDMDLVHIPRIIIAPLLYANILRHTFTTADLGLTNLLQHAECQLDLLMHGLLRPAGETA